jgi:hypothetical protein
MRTFLPPFKGSTLALSIALAAAWGCNANHVLGSADKPDGSTSTGVAGATNGGNGGSAATGGAGAPGAVQDAGVDEFTGGAADTSASTDAGTSRPEVGPLGPAQSWTGYVENYTFPSGSSAVHLTFATDASGNVAGQVAFGQGPPPPAPTNPNIGYPPALESLYSGGTGPGPVYQGYIAEGYIYQIDQGTFASDRLRFDISLNQLWAGWCALQTTPAGSPTCVANANVGFGTTQGGTCTYTDTTTSTESPIDCVKAGLCLFPNGPCDCSAGGPCKLSTRVGPSTNFDVFMTGDTASGSVVGIGSTPNVHFILDAPDAGGGG